MVSLRLFYGLFYLAFFFLAEIKGIAINSSERQWNDTIVAAGIFNAEPILKIQ